VVVVLATLAGFGSHYGRAYWIKAQGITLVPMEARPVAPVPFYLQNDPQWADDSLGASPYRMRGSGCLVACLAAAANGLGVDTNPARLNEAFGAKGVYTPAGEVIWMNIKEAVPGVDYEYSRVFGAATIQDDLAEGRLPIVKVKYRGSGAAHWLLVVGAAEDDFLVMDPLNAERTPLRLSTHGKCTRTGCWCRERRSPELVRPSRVFTAPVRNRPPSVSAWGSKHLLGLLSKAGNTLVEAFE